MRVLNGINNIHDLFDHIDSEIYAHVERYMLNADERQQLHQMLAEHHDHLAEQNEEGSSAPLITSRPTSIKAWIEVTRQLHEAIGACTHSDDTIYPSMISGSRHDDLQEAYNNLVALMRRGFPPDPDDIERGETTAVAPKGVVEEIRKKAHTLMLQYENHMHDRATAEDLHNAREAFNAALDRITELPELSTDSYDWNQYFSSYNNGCISIRPRRDSETINLDPENIPYFIAALLQAAKEAAHYD